MFELDAQKMLSASAAVGALPGARAPLPRGPAPIVTCCG